MAVFGALWCQFSVARCHLPTTTDDTGVAKAATSHHSPLTTNAAIAATEQILPEMPVAAAQIAAWAANCSCWEGIPEVARRSGISITHSRQCDGRSAQLRSIYIMRRFANFVHAKFTNQQFSCRNILCCRLIKKMTYFSARPLRSGFFPQKSLAISF